MSTKCSVESCPQPVFKNDLCIDHVRQGFTKGGQQVHDHLTQFGKKKLSVQEQCDELNVKFLADNTYNTDAKTLDVYKQKFMDMDLDGSGDIDIHELGLAMEKIGKPKNQLELKKMIDEVDLDHDGVINYTEFLIMMLGKKSSVLRLILMFEGMGKEKDKPQGVPPKKTIQELLNKSQ